MKESGKIIYKNKIKKEVDINNDIKNETDNKNESMSDKYIKQLNPLQLVAYEIAKSRLKSSFDIEKSIGFKSFIN
jgi:hypothetical protein